MNARFLDPAEQELADAAAYYNGRDDGVGDDLVREVQATIERILSGPRRWPIVRDDIRRLRVRRFPYTVLYGVEGDEVVVVAVAHDRRDPDYWVDRLK